MKPMITNGGPHPADKWADTTTDIILDLIQVTEDSVSPEALAARQAKRDLRPILFDIFMGHHDGIQKEERGAKIKSLADADDLVAKTIDLHPSVPSALAEVNSALGATPFAAHFAKPEVQAVLTNIIGQHSADVIHIERRYHQDRLAAKKGN